MGSKYALAQHRHQNWCICYNYVYGDEVLTHTLGKKKRLIIFHVITCMISFVYSHRACSNAHCYPSLGLCYSRLPGPSLQFNIVIKMAQPLLGKSCYITGCKWYLHFSTFKIWTHSPTSTHILMLFAMHIALPIFQLRFHNWEFVFRLQST